MSVLSHLAAPAATRVLLGPRSSGRTTLLRNLALRNAETGPTLRAPGPKSSAVDVLRAVLDSADIITADRSDAPSMRRLIDDYVRDRRELGQHIHFELDDADAFNAEAWHEVEHIVAAGSEPLLSLTRLDEGSSPAAAHVRRQRTPMLSVVPWLNRAEVADYLEWRFSRHGLAGVNTPTATLLIARLSQGRFDAIDYICQMALLLLRQREGCQLNVTLVREAAEQIRLRRNSRNRARESVDYDEHRFGRRAAL